MTVFQTACFTDIQGYSAKEDQEGHRANQEVLDEYQMIAQALVELNHGRYHKNTGDGLMATFADPEHALSFAVEHQQYLQEQPCIARQPLRVRVVLASGVVELKAADAFGEGVIKAARMVAIAKPNLVWANGALREHIRRVWGEKRTGPLFASLGQPALKGFSQEEELFEFDWQRYVETNRGKTLGQRVFACLRDAEIIASNLNSQHLTPPGRVVWPLVPRGLATAIHRGQLEIIRLLALLGWQIHLLVADCGAGGSAEKQAVNEFVAAVTRCAQRRGLCNIETSSLSSYFDVGYQRQKGVLDRFRAIATKLNVQDLIEINQKDYSKGVLGEIRKSPALDFLRPVLTCAAVLHLANEWQSASDNPKTIVVCGSDERTQWRRALDVATPPRCLGAILNPALRSQEEGETHTVRQRSDWPIWHAVEDLRDTMKGTNAAKWVFVMFGQLPSFPRSCLPPNEDLGNTEDLSAKSWEDEFGIPPGIDGLRLSDFVWPYLDLARD